jgi:excisionase family DNA binding protein
MVNETPMVQRELRLTEAELTEIGELFRKKLEQLRTDERRSRRRHATGSVPSRRLRRLGAVESEPNADAILSSAELAQLLGVHRRTVARWADDGMPTIRTIGGHRRFRWADVQRWIVAADGASP